MINEFHCFQLFRRVAAALPGMDSNDNKQDTETSMLKIHHSINHFHSLSLLLVVL